MVRSTGLVVLVAALAVGVAAYAFLRSGPQAEAPTGPRTSAPPILAVGEGQDGAVPQLDPIETAPLQDEAEEGSETDRKATQGAGLPLTPTQEARNKIRACLGGDADTTIGFMGGKDFRLEIASLLPNPEDARRDELRAQMREHERAYYKIQEELQKEMREFANAEMAAGRVQPVPPDGNLASYTQGLIPPFSVGANNDGFIVLKRGYSPEFDAQIVRVFDDEVSALRDSLRDSIRRVLSR